MSTPGLPLAVLDASVLVPHWSRVALRALALTTPPAYQPVWSTAIVAETWRILTIRALRAGQAERIISQNAQRLWHLLDSIMQSTQAATLPAGAPPSPLRDPDDAHLWQAAMHSGAQYIVSHNTQDFPPAILLPTNPDLGVTECWRHVVAGVEFLTAIEFIEDLLGADAIVLCGRPIPQQSIIRSQRQPARP